MRSVSVSPYAPLPRADLMHVLDRTRDLWADLAGARLFVTGGTGFIGRWLLESLVLANELLGVDVRAVVLSRKPGEFRDRAPHLAASGAVRLIPGDVRSFSVPTGSFTHLVHAAFDSARTIGDPALAVATLVDGTRQVLDLAREAGVSRMLFVSSGAVYGPQPADLALLSEDYPGAPDPLSPGSAYAEGKRAGELLCAIAAAAGLPVSIARCFAFIGPGLPLEAHFAAGNFLRDAHLGREIIVTSDGRPVRSYLHAADLAIWLWTILLRGKAGRAYNVGSEDAVSIADLARLIAAAAVPPTTVRVLGTPVAAPPERYLPDVGRARRELGLSASIPLRQAVERTMAWMGARCTA